MIFVLLLAILGVLLVNGFTHYNELDEIKKILERIEKK